MSAESISSYQQGRCASIPRTRRPSARGWIWTPLSALVLSAALAAPAAAQTADPVRIAGDGGACAACRVTVEKAREMGDAAGPGRLDRTLSSWARDGRGRTYVASGWEGPVRVFGPDGRFLRTLGESEPGDTVRRAIGHVSIAAGDTVHLLDEANSLRHVFTPDHRRARTEPVTPHLRASGFSLPLPGGRLAFAGTVPTRDAVGLPLHVMEADGTVSASFGSDAPELVPGGAPDVRRLAAAGAGALWAGHLTAYRVERWTLDGRREVAIERDASWFAPYTRTRWEPGEPPHPMLMAVRQDAAGRLWTLVRVADADWARAPRQPVDSAVAAAAPLLQYDLNDLYDTRIEVIDPRCGTLLVSHRVPVLLGGFLDDEHLLEWHLSGDAPPRLGVWRVGHNLTEPARSNTTCAT